MDLAKRAGTLAVAEKWPEALTQIVNPNAWCRAVALGEKYTEPIPDFISRVLAIETMSATTIEEVFANAGITGLQEWLPNVPGATTGPILIDSVYVTESDYTDGAPTYVIIEGQMLETGEPFKTTTGAMSIQAALIGFLNVGHWPIRCQIKRGDTKGAGDTYLMFIFPPD
jgi:hypothetical protein